MRRLVCAFVVRKPRRQDFLRQGSVIHVYYDKCILSWDVQFVLFHAFYWPLPSWIFLCTTLLPIFILLICCNPVTSLCCMYKQSGNSVDLDQMASSEAIWSGSTVFPKYDKSGFSKVSARRTIRIYRYCSISVELRRWSGDGALFTRLDKYRVFFHISNC